MSEQCHRSKSWHCFYGGFHLQFFVSEEKLVSFDSAVKGIMVVRQGFKKIGPLAL